ncbi:hypothetical protein MHTCC0001_35630 [Flavobacteriaceae bacterium MHTCC 0001]
MKRISHTIVYMLIIFLTTLSTSSFVKKGDSNFSIISITPQELLKSKNWNIQGLSKETFFQYTDDEEILYVENQIFQKTKYYISDSNCFKTSFDPNKIGQVNNGKFFVTQNGCYYITIISDKVIQLSYLHENNPKTTTLISKE